VFQPLFEDGVIWRRTVADDLGTRRPVGRPSRPRLSIDRAAGGAFKAQLPPAFGRNRWAGGEQRKATRRSLLVALIVVTLSLLMLQLGSFFRSLLVVLTRRSPHRAGLALLVAAARAFFALLGSFSLAGMIMRNSYLVDHIHRISRGRRMGCDHGIHGAADAAISLTAAGGAGYDSRCRRRFLGADGGGSDGD